ncbi:hypothetical protein RRG08_002922 [Elysia crispata]|uniref:Uncharacterized protein n=1 Tax=Elysia crispata TaxID=231223 RepID=A0AAE1E269_9GAST|nr:hypothetical protein RRG08_002922 [Elysia crispata]
MYLNKIMLHPNSLINYIVLNKFRAISLKRLKEGLGVLDFPEQEVKYQVHKFTSMAYASILVSRFYG